MEMRHSILCILVLTIWPANCLGQDDWKLKRDKKGITIYMREQAESPLKEYKARAVISHPIQEVFDFLSNLERHPEWVFRCTGLTIIDIPGENQIMYHTSYDIPWPMKDRDLTVETFITHYGGGNKIESLTQNISLDYPTAEGVIRMPGYREWVMLEKIDSRNTLFITEGYADPGGKVPPWLVNMFLVDGIFDSVIRIMEVLEDQDN